jgi:hypothetical protein
MDGGLSSMNERAVSTRRIARHLSYANVTAALALFVALGGISWAAVVLPNNSVGTTQLKKTP